MDENFFVISSASSDVNVENTRSSFTNVLPKTFSSETGKMYIAAEIVVFDNIFTYYESVEGVPDLILSYNKQAYKPSFGRCDTLLELCEKMNECFIIFTQKHKQQSESCTIEMRDNKIKLKLHFGLVKMSRKLFDFLNINEYIRKVKNAGEIFYVLREETEPVNIQCFSAAVVKINERKLDFIDVFCDPIESYPSENDSFSKVVCSLPIDYTQGTTYFNFSSPQFHKLEASYLRMIKIEFRQQNGEKVFFDKGSPNLVKFKLKMKNMKTEFFYITVSSKPTDNFPENTPSRFEIELPREYTLSGEWVVSVADAYIPPPRNFIKFDHQVFEVDEKESYFCVWPTAPNANKKCAKLDLLKFTKRELCIFFAVNFPDFFNIHLDENENIFLTMKNTNDIPHPIQLYTSRKLMSILNLGNFLHVEEQASKNTDWYEGFKEVTTFIKNSRMNYSDVVGGLIDKYHSQLPETSLFFEMNAFYGINDISQVLLTQMDAVRMTNLQNQEFVKKEEHRLMEWHQRNRSQSIGELLPSFFFIYSNFVKETPMGDRYANILKTIPYKNGLNSLPGGFYSFQTNECYNICGQYLRSLDFMVKTQSGEGYKFFSPHENIRLTLKFQKL